MRVGCTHPKQPTPRHPRGLRADIDITGNNACGGPGRKADWVRDTNLSTRCFSHEAIYADRIFESQLIKEIGRQFDRFLGSLGVLSTRPPLTSPWNNILFYIVV